MAERVHALAREIRAYCSEHADPQQAARYTRYFTEGYDPWGVQQKDPLWNEKQKAWLEEYEDLGLSGFLFLGELLFRGGKYEEGSLAIRFVAEKREQFDTKAFCLLAKWFEAGVGNWAHTDVLCGQLIAPLLETRRIGLAALSDWRGSPFKYQRRAVPVAMLGLLERNPKIGPLLKFLVPMMMDSGKVVQQGLGWFLREAWKKEPRAVEAFLLQWKDRAPRLILQYATEKMTPQARVRFRRGRSR